MWPHGLYSLWGSFCPWDFPGKYGVGCHFLLQRIFSSQRSNPHLLHWQLDSLPMSHQGSPHINIYNWYIFFLDCSLGHYIFSFFVSYNSLYFKVIFFWYMYRYYSFFFYLHFHGILFSIPSLSICICPYKWSRSLVNSVYMSLAFGYVGRVHNFLSSVLLQQRFEMEDQCYTSVTAQSFIQ